MGLMRKALRSTSGLPVREPGKRGEHRTEVTEVAEGIGILGERSAVNVWDSEREAVDGKSIHRGTEGIGRGGLGIGGKKVAVNVRASAARNRRIGSGDVSHTLPDTGTDTDTSFGRSLTLPKKNWRNTEVLRQSLT
jgi:hypothetical protein